MSANKAQMQLFPPDETFPVSRRRGRPPKPPKFLTALDESDDSGIADIAAQVHAGLCQTALPYSRPLDDSKPWERRGIGATLTVTPGFARRIEGGERVPVGVPYGSKARLIMIYIQTMGFRSRVVPLGTSMSAWIRSLGLSVTGGRKGTIGEIKEQILRLSNCQLILEVTERLRSGAVRTVEQRASIASGLQLWADQPGREQWPNEIELDDRFYHHLQVNAVALDKAAVAALSGHSLGLDTYASLAHWLPRIGSPMAMKWSQLVQAFGSEGETASTFGRRLRNVLPAVCKAYPTARVEVNRTGLLLYPSPPPVPEFRVGWTSGLKALTDESAPGRDR